MTSNRGRAADSRRTWRAQWLGLLAEFAQPELQRRLWLNLGDGSEMSSFTELTCRYFDDLGLSDGIDRAVELDLISIEEAAAVRSFHAIADRYRPVFVSDDVAILNDAGWQKVVTAAQQARAVLLPLLGEVEWQGPR